jgi:hypothetical protein
MLTGKCKTSNVAGAEGSGDGLALRKAAGRTPPRPRAKKTAAAAADEGKSAQDRIAMLLGGGMGPAKASKRTDASPQGPADEIIAFLKEKGLLS